MDQIGRYKILSELGRGAMGVVYLARDTKIGREVAIKTIKLADQADGSETERLRERLFREAQSAGRLSHPGIVTIYDVAEEAGLAYITMEFVDGETLQALMDSGRAEDAEFIADILRQTAAALDYAHSKEIVHRDIKPANIMVTGDGIVKITDFGIARISSSQLTQTGTVMGTPSYMSPEQVRGDPISGASDQFSLGVITYELLTGEKPFAGDSLTAVMFKIVSGEVTPPSEISPGISNQLENAVLRALSKSGEDRFPSCVAYAEAVSISFKPAGSAAPERQTGAAEIAEESATIVMPAVSTGAAPSVPQEQLETVVLPLPEESAQTAAMPELSPLGAEDIEEVEEAKRDGSWIAIAVVAGILVAGGAFWIARNTGFIGGIPDLMVSTQGPDSGETPPTGEDAGMEPGTRGTDGASSSPEVILVPIPAVEPPESATPDVASAVPETGSAGGEAGSAAVETLPQTPPAAEVPALTPPNPEPAPPPAPRKAAPLRVVAVNFSTPQPGARVVVDGRPQWSCATPCSIDLPRGEHTAIVSLGGFHRVRKTFDVGTDPLDLPFDLEAVVGTVLVSSSPAGADVFVDGKKMDQKTNASLRLRPGYHLIKVEKAGAGSGEQSVLVSEGDLRTSQFVLSTSPPRAKLIVKTTPPGARIVLNDRQRSSGATPAELDLAPGSYRISLSLAGHRPSTKDIELSADNPVTIEEVLSPRN